MACRAGGRSHAGGNAGSPAAPGAAGVGRAVGRGSLRACPPAERVVGGVVLAAKKSSRTAAEGLLSVAQTEKKAVVVELNCETDFVARNDVFQYLVSIHSTLVKSLDFVLALHNAVMILTMWSFMI